MRVESPDLDESGVHISHVRGQTSIELYES